LGVSMAIDPTWRLFNVDILILLPTP